MTKFKAKIKQIKVTRTTHFSRSLNGNEVKKLMNSANIKALCAVLKPQKGIGTDGHTYVVGNTQQRENIYLLFNKLKLCFDLVSAARMMCSHEVDLLAKRCISLGKCFPTAFPNENLKYKFHILTVHAPQKASRSKRCGLETEQG